jgi:catechol 2,3-dioxygenase-like lactoylglutathione lyase family enzyme
VQGAKFEPVSLTHLSVTCSDFDKSYAFYRDVVGLKVVPSSDSEKSDAHRLPGEINCPTTEENVPFSLMDFKATGESTVPASSTGETSPGSPPSI